MKKNKTMKKMARQKKTSLKPPKSLPINQKSLLRPRKPTIKAKEKNYPHPFPHNISTIWSQELFNHIPVSIFVKDSEGRVIFMNRACEDQWGVQAHRILGTDASEFFTPEQIKSYKKWDKETFQKRKIVDIAIEETTHSRLGSRFAHTVKIPTYDDRGAPAFLIGITEDITERKKMENALLETQGRLQKYFELGLVGMAITAPDKRWLFVNQRLCEILGYTKEEILRLSWDQVTHPDDLALNMANFDRLLRGEADHYQMEKRFMRKDGKVVFAMVSVSCLRRVDGTVEYMQALIEDISNQRRAEQERQKMQEQISQSAKLVTLGTLGAGLAHELNNPLTIIKGLADILLKKLGHEAVTPERLKELMAQIKDQSERMITIIGHVREFGRNTATEKASLWNINSIINESMILLRKQFENHHIGFDLQFADNLPMIWAKKVKMQSVFQNLLSNAKDAFDSIQQADKKICIVTSLGSEARTIQVLVSDNGPGISAENMDKIFDPFFTTKDKGMGLGLALVKDVLKEHGGEITVDGRPGEGAVFKLILPVGQGD
jgi:PAS domain S-box-containing protein